MRAIQQPTPRVREQFPSFGTLPLRLGESIVSGRLRGQPGGSPGPLNQSDSDGGPAAARFAFLLTPGYTAIGFTCATETLRISNMVLGQPRFRAFTLTLDGAPVAASNGQKTLPDYAIANTPDCDFAFVCGPNPIIYPNEKALIRWLLTLADHGIALGGICTGSYLLAQAGLLNGYRCTIHWQDLEYLRENFPELIISRNIFELDRDRFTCSGGTASMDMMLQLLRERFLSAEEVALACELLLCDRVRDSRDRQRVPLRHRLGPRQNKLSEAVAIMEANPEEPLSLEELAFHVQVSSRQLERLFRDHLACSPMTYYMELRLSRARNLLLTTALPITEIANRCGFSSPSHFTRRYTKLFGVIPRRERQ